MGDQTVQRSFRIAARTLELLDAAAAETAESRNALADRLLGEGVRLERHPLIRFRSGAAGLRYAHVIGTRLRVHQVISSLRAGGGVVEDVAEDLRIDARLVRAAVSYYAEFDEEVDAAAAAEERLAAAERARWERQRAFR